MKYKRILSIYNSLRYTYSTMVKNDPKGLELEWFSTIDTPFEYEENGVDFLENSIQEFKNQFELVKDKVDGISIVFPAEIIMVSQFPIEEDVQEEDIRSLLNIEITKAFPTLDIQNFVIYSYRLEKRADNQDILMCVIYPKIDINRYEELFSNYNKEIISLNVSQISAANCFLYNYPEYRNTVSAIVGIQGNFVDFTILKNSKILYYNLLSYQQDVDIPQILTNEILKVNESIINKIDNGLFCYGEDLNDGLFNEIKESLTLIGVGTHKLNAFRMMRANFNEKEIDYCKRNMHIFPPVIGASFPSFFEALTF